MEVVAPVTRASRWVLRYTLLTLPRSQPSHAHICPSTTTSHNLEPKAGVGENEHLLMASGVLALPTG